MDNRLIAGGCRITGREEREFTLVVEAWLRHQKVRSRLAHARRLTGVVGRCPATAAPGTARSGCRAFDAHPSFE
jgi:hypothetical protein